MKTDFSQLESRESRALGGIRPPTDSIAAEAKRMAHANERGETLSYIAATSTSQTSTLPDRSTRANHQKEANFQAAVDAIAPKMQNDPSSITKEDANLLRSCEARAHGQSKNGGITAQAQRFAVGPKVSTYAIHIWAFNIWTVVQSINP